MSELEERKKTFDELMFLYDLNEKEMKYLVVFAMFMSLNCMPCDKSMAKVFSALAYWAESFEEKSK